MKYLIPLKKIEHKIYWIRGHRAMLDQDLAHLYGIPVKRLKQQVNRNLDRFPDDFLFRLTVEESEALMDSRLRNATMKRGKNVKYGLYAFSEQGVAQLSTVLRTQRAILVNIEVVRAFVRFRRILESNIELTKKLHELEKRVGNHDDQIQSIFQAIYDLMNPSKPIGFER